MATPVTFPFYVEIDGEEVEYEITCTVTPGSPGRTYGDPASCYPPEDPEVEVVLVRDGLGAMTAADTDCVVNANWEAIEEIALEQAVEMEADAVAEKADHDRERDREDRWEREAERRAGREP